MPSGAAAQRLAHCRSVAGGSVVIRRIIAPNYLESDLVPRRGRAVAAADNPGMSRAEYNEVAGSQLLHTLFERPLGPSERGGSLGLEVVTDQAPVAGHLQELVASLDGLLIGIVVLKPVEA